MRNPWESQLQTNCNNNKKKGGKTWGDRQSTHSRRPNRFMLARQFRQQKVATAYSNQQNHSGVFGQGLLPPQEEGRGGGPAQERGQQPRRGISGPGSGPWRRPPAQHRREAGGRTWPPRPRPPGPPGGPPPASPPPRSKTGRPASAAPRQRESPVPRTVTWRRGHPIGPLPAGNSGRSSPQPQAPHSGRRRRQQWPQWRPADPSEEGCCEASWTACPPEGGAARSPTVSSRPQPSPKATWPPPSKMRFRDKHNAFCFEVQFVICDCPSNYKNCSVKKGFNHFRVKNSHFNET